MLKTLQNIVSPFSHKLRLREMSKHTAVKFTIGDVSRIIPELTSGQHKGESGRIGVIGGSREYTGAPYFSAISALRLGADLAHVFCSQSAGTAIKCYSPDLIVHPILDDDHAIQQLEEWLPRLHVVIVGPGLGRDPGVVERTGHILKELKRQNKTTIIDADGLHVVTKVPELLCDFNNAIITPNEVEFQRLCNAVSINVNDDDAEIRLALYFNGVTVVRKGKTDKIFNSKCVCSVTGGTNRRCGGQGDILSGATAIFMYWAELLKDENKKLLAGFCACTFTKKLNEAAFAENGRGMVTGDMIAHISSVLRDIFLK